MVNVELFKIIIMKFEIRNYHITDLSSLYKICLLTGNNGGDSSLLLDDPDLVGHLFAAPYAIFEPELCFILLKDSIPSGYILGTRDSMNFYEKCEKKWFLELRKRYPMPDDKDESIQANFIRYLYQKQKIVDGLDKYPAHLHIDILPIAQGNGYGRKLVEAFLNQLRTLNIQGLHLIVSNDNQNAVGFYQQVGFQKLKNLGGSIVFGMVL